MDVVNGIMVFSFYPRGYERPERPVPGDCGYHLHAHRVVFPHPVTNEVHAETLLCFVLLYMFSLDYIGL